MARGAAPELPATASGGSANESEMGLTTGHLVLELAIAVSFRRPIHCDRSRFGEPHSFWSDGLDVTANVAGSKP